MFDDRYEVDFETYRDFLHTLMPGKFKQNVSDDGKVRTLIITSNTTLKDICGYIRGEIGEPRYYIFALPEKFEAREVRPTVRVTLETPQQVQAVIDGLKKMQKGEE